MWIAVTREIKVKKIALFFHHVLTRQERKKGNALAILANDRECEPWAIHGH